MSPKIAVFVHVAWTFEEHKKAAGDSISSGLSFHSTSLLYVTKLRLTLVKHDQINIHLVVFMIDNTSLYHQVWLTARAERPSGT